jgi:hypothetical protein
VCAHATEDIGGTRTSGRDCEPEQKSGVERRQDPPVSPRSLHLVDQCPGLQYLKGAIRCYSFTQWAEYDLPGGYYVDMTNIIPSTREFERIKAQNNWANSYNKAEWWHFQCALNKQDTFSDELEWVGYSEDQLRRAGWSTDANLDHKRG